MKVDFIVPETLINTYRLDVDEAKLKEKGLSIKEYLEKYNGNPWKAQESDPDTPIRSIELLECADVLEMEAGKAKIVERKDLK
jgi:hypothetical protein